MGCLVLHRERGYLAAVARRRSVGQDRPNVLKYICIIWSDDHRVHATKGTTNQEEDRWIPNYISLRTFP